ncbi:MAG: LysR substrate-binding domain-containing protein [Pararhodobacter sp.]
MDAADLKIFETVVRLGSMSRASEELNTVQSNVTTRIQALERELGVKLLLRTNRGVSPTPAGKRLLPYAAVLARVLGDARQAAIDNGTPAGPLSVGTLETTAAMRLSSVMARYTSTYPDVDLTLRTGTTCELIDQVLDSRLDGAFVCGPVNHQELAEEFFFDEELVVLTAPNVKSLDAYLTRPSLKIIVLRAGCSYRLILEAALARRGVVGFRLLEFGTLESIFSTVSAGLGLTLFPKRLVGSVCPEGRVAVHSFGGNECRVQTVFVRRHDAYASSALTRFLDTARAIWDIGDIAAE